MLLKIFRRSTRRNFLLLLIVLVLMLICEERTIRNETKPVNVPKKIFEWKKENPELKVKYISKLISKYNLEEYVLNTHLYGNIKNDTAIFVIVLDKFSNHLNTSLVSLSQVQGIEETLIVFSHSFYDENLNSIIRNIDFCLVLQIFYPYSIQTHPLVFPGQHPNDCPYSMNKKTADAINCTGASFQDLKGHYRNPFRAERKHHWWWTSNMIFEKMNYTNKYSGIVIFLDHHFIFIKDFIYMILYMRNIARSLPQCDFLSMGTNSLPNTVEDNIYSLELTTWDPKKHSSLMAFDSTTWNSIVSHYDIFCSVDDTSWIRSLFYMSLHRKNGETFNVLSSLTPRAYDMVACDCYGVFGCNVENTILRIMNLEKQYKDNWFPSHLELYIHVELEDDADIIFDYEESEGGWADPRDTELCLNMTANKMKKVLMEIKYQFHG